MERKVQVIIEQLDDQNKVYRRFTSYPCLSQLDEALIRIRKAYNMNRTRVWVDDEFRIGSEVK